MVAWLILVLVPAEYKADKILINIIVLALCGVYAWLAFQNFHPFDLKNFGSLNGVATLFQNKYILAAGWIHYLAFDLMAGIFIRRNAVQHGIAYGFVLVCLIFTFLMGPLGLAIYLLIRWIGTKRFFADNF